MLLVSSRQFLLHNFYTLLLPTSKTITSKCEKVIANYYMSLQHKLTRNNKL